MSRTSGGQSRRGHEPASGAVAGILAPVRAGAGVTVDEDASIPIGRVLEARMCRVRAEEQRVAGLRQDRYGVALAQRGAIVAFEVDSAPFRALSGVISSSTINVCTKLPRPLTSVQVPLPLSRCWMS